VWYRLLTDERFFKSCKKVNDFALKFINSSPNEAVVEVEVSNIKDITSEKRPLLQKKKQKCPSSSGGHELSRKFFKHPFMQKTGTSP